MAAGDQESVALADQLFDLILAASVLSLIPMLIVYGLCQKYIISGLTAGSVKG